MNKRQRLLRLLLTLAALAAAGLGYALVFRRFGGIPCLFRKVTGLLCPGCGVSHMCVSLLEGDLASAWRYNPALLCISPMFAALCADIAVRYVREGDMRPHKWANVLLWIMIVVLLLFGLARNL